MQIRTVAVFHCQSSAVPASPWCCAEGIVATFRAMGYKVIDCGRPSLKNIPIEVLETVDLIVMSAPEWYFQILIERYGEVWSALKAPKVAWYSETAHREDCDPPYDFLRGLSHLQYYPAIQDAEAFGGRWLPFGIDPTLFNPKPVAKLHGAAFIGTLYPKRAAYMQALGYPLTILPLIADDDQIRCVELLAEAYSSVQIVVNLPSYAHVIVTKVIEAMACRTMVITPEVEYAPARRNMDVFESGKHLVYYDSARPETVGPLIEHYLAHPEEAQAIAQAGWEEVLRAHTLRHRLETLISDVEALFPAPAFRALPTASPPPGIDFNFINLASCPERREAMERQFDRLGLTAARFEGIVPDADPPGGRRAVLGCHLSHRGVIEGAAADTYSVVLEDDVDLATIFAQAVSPSTLEAVKDFDIVFLECLAFHPSYEMLRGFHEIFRQGGGRPDSLTLLRPFTAYCAGACAYVVTPRGKRTLPEVFAENLLRPQPEWAIDQIYLNAVSEGRMQGAIMAPFVASPGGLNRTSTIGYSPPTHAIIARWQGLVDGFRRSLFVDVDPLEVAAEVAPFIPGLEAGDRAPDHLQRQILLALDEILAEPGFPEDYFQP